jgi:hypothetical protein
MYIKLQSENLKGNDQMEDSGTDKRIILKWVLKKNYWRVWMD